MTRNVLVSGAGVGIGLAIADAFIDNGDTVTRSYLTHQPPTRHGVTDIQVDLTSPDGPKDFVFAATGARSCPVDVLVNNAGGILGRVDVAEMTDDHWSRVIELNLTSAFRCIRAALPHMRDGGRIINISSLAGHNGGGNGASAYAAAKAGLEGLSRALSKELAERGITVNSVAPGLIVDTPFHETFNTPEGIQNGIQGIPVGRAGTPADVAIAVLHLAAPEAGFITGTTSLVTGGAEL